MVDSGKVYEIVRKNLKNLRPSLEVLRIEPLPEDASNRRYYRLFLDGGEPERIILMELADPEGFKASEEKVSGGSGSIKELPFVNIQRFLAGSGVGVPALYHYEVPAGLLFLEDLGDATLEVVLRDQTVEAWGPFYRRAIDELLSIQIRESKKQDGRCIAFGRAFDVPLLMWEFDHFLEYGIEARHGKAIHEPDRSRIRVLFQEISERLAKEPRCLTHRDYHSRNLMVQGDRIRVLDFQDALMGPYQYDLASLLRDSYVTLPEGLVDSLIDYYLDRREALEGVPIDHGYFREIFDLMSIQRNLKAAGRFVYIDRVKHNPRFLPYVAPTLGYVKRNLSRYPALEPLGQLLRPFVEEFNLP